MPARIVTEVGPPSTVGNSRLIEQDVILLGRDGAIGARQTDLIAGHAATVEYRDRKYRVYNKLTTSSLRIGTRTVPPRGSSEWQHGEQLELGASAVLRLEIEGDPAPMRDTGPVFTAQDVGVATEEESAPAQTPRKSKTLQYTVVAVCCVGLVFALITEEDAPTNKGNPQARAELIAELRKEQSDSNDPDAIWRLLQDAQLDEARGQKAEANRKYRRTTLLLRQKYGEGLENASAAQKKADALARSRLKAS